MPFRYYGAVDLPEVFLPLRFSRIAMAAPPRDAELTLDESGRTIAATFFFHRPISGDAVPLESRRAKSGDVSVEKPSVEENDAQQQQQQRAAGASWPTWSLLGLGLRDQVLAEERRALESRRAKSGDVSVEKPSGCGDVSVEKSSNEANETPAEPLIRFELNPNFVAERAPSNEKHRGLPNGTEDQ